MYKHALAIVLLTFYVSVSHAQTCVIQGCSGELCLSQTEQNFLSTCIWKAEYGCYKDYGVCEPNATGGCGWRQSNDLVTCIRQVEAAVQAADTISD